MTKQQILFTCSEEFKTAAGSFAQRNNISLSELIRQAVGDYIGYDFSKEPARIDGRRKYDNAEARKEAQRERAKKAKQEVLKLLDIYAKEERLQDVLGIEESLARKGISLD